MNDLAGIGASPAGVPTPKTKVFQVARIFDDTLRFTGMYRCSMNVAGKTEDVSRTTLIVAMKHEDAPHLQAWIEEIEAASPRAFVRRPGR